MMYRLLSFSADLNDQRHALYWLKHGRGRRQERRIDVLLMRCLG